MWTSLTLVSILIAVIFWLIMETSIRVSYEQDNVDQVDRLMWTTLERYGLEDYSETLRLLADSDDCYIQLLQESDGALLLSFDADGTAQTTETAQASGIIPEDLFARLDASGGVIGYRVDDAGRNLTWNVKAAVTAYDATGRYVLILSKALTNLNLILSVFRKRLMFVLLGVLVGAVLIAFFFTRHFAGPVNRLTERAKQMAEGDYDSPFPRQGPTEVLALSDTLKGAATEFRATEELRRDFISNVTHDMKTPLTVIRMNAEMIETVAGNDPQRRSAYLSGIIAEVDHLSEFISDMMELSRLQSGTWLPELAPFHLNLLISACVNTMEPNPGAGGGRIVVRACQGLYVRADSMLIGRVLENLLSNALKFSPGDREIQVTAFHGSEATADVLPRLYAFPDAIAPETEVKPDPPSLSPLVYVCVRDFGPGVPKNQQEQIWDRYYHVDPLGRENTGTGIGLNIIREIMRLHHRPCGVISEEGKGCLFWIALESAPAPREQE